MAESNCTAPDTTMQQGKMVKFPDYDLYGNYTNLDNVVAVNGMTPPKGPSGQKLYTLGSLYSNQCGGSSYSPTSTSNPCQIGLASWQATVHQAWKIWNQIVWTRPPKRISRSGREFELARYLHHRFR